MITTTLCPRFRWTRGDRKAAVAANAAKARSDATAGPNAAKAKAAHAVDMDKEVGVETGGTKARENRPPTADAATPEPGNPSSPSPAQPEPGIARLLRGPRNLCGATRAGTALALLM